MIACTILSAIFHKMISMAFREHQGLDNKTPDEVSEIKTECENNG